jgi:hypothetical protein
MLYSGLVGPDDIFDPATAAKLAGLAFLGDDFSGCVVGFDRRAGWRLVGVDNGSAPEPLEQRTLAEFIAQRVADAQDAEPFYGLESQEKKTPRGSSDKPPES